ncbi:hypothetical protein A3Q56_02979 [Intoshia linei]|uniref:Uncharacterized protein n=1 Tax=Intoshia linei TaxID=1819745 RepID=A0A177B4V9_9BILA|nr:hypothetical protein A3Q56_02979 [Intoshia linei]
MTAPTYWYWAREKPATTNQTYGYEYRVKQNLKNTEKKQLNLSTPTLCRHEKGKYERPFSNYSFWPARPTAENASQRLESDKINEKVKNSEKTCGKYYIDKYRAKLLNECQKCKKPSNDRELQKKMQAYKKCCGTNFSTNKNDANYTVRSKPIQFLVQHSDIPRGIIVTRRLPKRSNIDETELKTQENFERVQLWHTLAGCLVNVYPSTEHVKVNYEN